jgi:hypothetical protein
MSAFSKRFIEMVSIAFFFTLSALIMVSGPARGADLKTKLEALENAYRTGVLSQEEYQIKRAQVLAESDQAALAKPINPAHARKAGQIYRHPTGISVWYPEGWQAKMLEGILQLVPPGAAATAEAFESYYLTAEDVSGLGIQSANHPSVTRYLDDSMQSLGMHLGGIFFQRTGELTTVNTSQGGDQGIRLDYVAQSNIGPIQGCAYALIIRNYGFALAGVGVKDLLKMRQEEVLRVFSSLGVGEGKMDSILVGTWHLSSTFAIRNESVWETDYSRARSVSESNSVLEFHADGSWIREDKSEMIAGAGSVWIESKDRKVYRGKWNADAGQLFMVWEDESFEDYRYRVQGNQLKMVVGTKGQLWTRAK